MWRASDAPKPSDRAWTVGLPAASVALDPAPSLNSEDRARHRARTLADAQRDRVKAEADADLQRRLEENRKAVEAENRKLLEQVRREVVELTLLTAEKVTGKVLDKEDQRRLIDEAVGEIDFDRLARSN